MFEFLDGADGVADTGEEFMEMEFFEFIGFVVAPGFAGFVPAVGKTAGFGDEDAFAVHGALRVEGWGLRTGEETSA